MEERKVYLDNNATTPLHPAVKQKIIESGILNEDKVKISYEEAVKGIRESLVMVDQLAFIVNVPNNTVITAMDQSQANENIFTNIDGAVFV